MVGGTTWPKNLRWPFGPRAPRNPRSVPENLRSNLFPAGSQGAGAQASGNKMFGVWYQTPCLLLLNFELFRSNLLRCVDLNRTFQANELRVWENENPEAENEAQATQLAQNEVGAVRGRAVPLLELVGQSRASQRH